MRLVKAQYDYTVARLGKRMPPYNRKVVLCPKCGRRGVDNGSTGLTRDKKAQSFSVTHTGRLEMVADTPFFSTGEWCSYTVPLEEVQRA